MNSSLYSLQHLTNQLNLQPQIKGKERDESKRPPQKALTSQFQPQQEEEKNENRKRPALVLRNPAIALCVKIPRKAIKMSRTAQGIKRNRAQY